jgi:alanyl-tRNA synthetase
VLQVTDTRPGLEGFYVHSARVVSGEARTGEQAHAEVDADRREAVTRSHTATHTLHWALRDQLGEHARQQGSLVDAGRLRFDFAHFQAVPAERLAEIEAAVNRQLLADPEVKVWHGSLAEAEAAGAISLFGERYGSVVRVVDVGDFSRELCGGTHVGHGSQVGPVHVLGEASIGANLRRIEALTGLEALHYVDRERQLLAEISALLKTRPEDAPEQLRRRLEALATAQRELERLRVAGLDRLAGDVVGRLTREAGGWLVVERVPEAGADDLRRIATGVRDRAGGGAGVVVLGSEVEGKAAMVALLSRELAGTGAAARDVLARAAKAVGGGAGGKGDLASAGGRDPGKLDEALGIAREDAMGLLSGGEKGPMG